MAEGTLRRALDNVRRMTHQNIRDLVRRIPVRDFRIAEAAGWFEITFDDSHGVRLDWELRPMVRFSVARSMWETRIGGARFFTVPCPLSELVLELRGYLMAGPVGEADVVLDAGPWSGVTAMYFAAAAPQGRVVLLEPEAESAAFLERQIQANGFANCSVVRAALYNRSGEVGFIPEKGGTSHVAEGEAAETTVPAVTLDDLARDHGLDDADLLKLDIEGAETAIAGQLGAFVAQRPGCRAAVASYHPMEHPSGRMRTSAYLEHVLGKRGDLFVRTLYPYHETTWLARADDAQAVDRLSAHLDFYEGWARIEAKAAPAARGTQGFIKERHDVAEPDAERVHSAAAEAPGFGMGMAFVGLPGSGAGAVAQGVAEALGLPMRVAKDAADIARAAEQGAVVAVALDLLEGEDVRRALGGLGRVFYVMAETQDLVARLKERSPTADEEELRSGLGRLRGALEPQALGLAGFILPAGAPPQERLADALGKARLGA